jgi:hypothetical protein
MQIRITVEVFSKGDDIAVDTPIAQGEISGVLDLKKGSTTQPVLSIKMRNILDQVRETIYKDSQP